ncbi:hypothetical protein SAY87_002071 [Trapa incisa]|uniref:Uncharacterized protein n=1 Tax=Trapa incisa TaxID=236973 RepID=A0AAN7JV61_9MYRT|nr:hypothetical protein SAY87_002071 [Trapa incisa]
MAGVNPTWWWNINGIPSPPPLPLHAPPVSFGGLSSSSIFTDHLYVPTASGASASSSPSSSYSWQDFINPELSESCSQLLLKPGTRNPHKDRPYEVSDTHYPFLDSVFLKIKCLLVRNVGVGSGIRGVISYPK